MMQALHRASCGKPLFLRVVSWQFIG